MAFFGLVKNPQPRGALKPSECLMTRFTDVRAAIRFFKEGIRNPNFMALTMSRFPAPSAPE